MATCTDRGYDQPRVSRGHLKVSLDPPGPRGALVAKDQVRHSLLLREIDGRVEGRRLGRLSAASLLIS